MFNTVKTWIDALKAAFHLRRTVQKCQLLSMDRDAAFKHMISAYDAMIRIEERNNTGTLSQLKAERQQMADWRDEKISFGMFWHIELSEVASAVLEAYDAA